MLRILVMILTAVAAAVLSVPARAQRITSAPGNGAIYLNDVVLTQTAAISLALGPRQLDVASNCQVGDRMVMVPSDAAPPPVGYMLGDIRCLTAGTARATLYAPLLVIGASYTITARVIAFR